jgi:site-specific recombinase XerD
MARGQRVTVTLPARVPDRRDISVSFTLGKEVKFSLQTRDPTIAKDRASAATQQLERLFEAYRNGPRPLLQKERVALAGKVYEEWANSFEDEPGEPEIWDLVKQANKRAMSDPERMEKWFGEGVDQLLQREGIVTDAASRKSLIAEVARAMNDAADKLRRNANSDYRPDPNRERYPKWQGASRANGATTTLAGGSLTFENLFQRWQREREPSPSTITTWRAYIRAFRKHLGHDDPSRVTKTDIVAWKDALVSAGYARKGIKDGQLAAVRTLYAYAVDNDIVTDNPAQGVKLQAKRVAGARMLAYTDDEVARLLTLADNKTNPNRRWLPWLMALSGARVGEVAQLWGQRIAEVDGVLVMKIAPAEDGGSLKNEGSERAVPLHSAILKRGFLEFVRARGSGPLFYRARAKETKAVAESRHTSKGIANHLAEWVRENGFTDKRKAPNHALRHWFKTACQRAGVLDSVADAIQGHRGKRGEADGYRHSNVRVMRNAIERVCVPQLPRKNETPQ